MSDSDTSIKSRRSRAAGHPLPIGAPPSSEGGHRSLRAAEVEHGVAHLVGVGAGVRVGVGIGIKVGVRVGVICLRLGLGFAFGFGDYGQGSG